MIRRILILSGIGLAVAAGARLALSELTSRAWDARRRALEELAIHPPERKQPWEEEFEALRQRLSSSSAWDELEDKPHRPHVAWGTGPARPLDMDERAWVENAWSKLDGLDEILQTLRALPDEDTVGSGALSTKLMSLRRFVNALCGRAWMALDDGDDEAAAKAWGDALRLARATESGTTAGVMVRGVAEWIVLSSTRLALERGASPTTIRAELAPLLAQCTYSPERAEHVVRRELSNLAALTDEELSGGDAALALAQHRFVEDAIALTHEPASSSTWETLHEDPRGNDFSLRTLGTFFLHAMHARANIALTGLAVAQYREERGVFPTTLSELEDLAPEHWLDPLSGTPLPYELTRDGARIGPAAWGERVEKWKDIERSPYVWNLRWGSAGSGFRPGRVEPKNGG